MSSGMITLLPGEKGLSRAKRWIGLFCLMLVLLPSSWRLVLSLVSLVRVALLSRIFPRFAPDRRMEVTPMETIAKTSYDEWARVQNKFIKVGRIKKKVG